MVSTPAQVHPLSAVSTHAEEYPEGVGGGWGGGGMVSTCLPPNKHTRSRATDGVRYWGRVGWGWGLGRGGVGHTRSRASA